MCYLIATENGNCKMSQIGKGDVKKANILAGPVSVEEGIGQNFSFTITEE